MREPGSLKQDICAQKLPGIRRLEVEAVVIKAHIKAQLAYTYNHWAYHLEMSEPVLDDTHEALEFLRTYFLYWFEAMSWSGRASAMIRTIQALQKLAKVRHALQRSCSPYSSSPQYSEKNRQHFSNS
jgi:hypothetical protein